MFDVKEFISNLEGLDEKGNPKSKTDFIFSVINMNTNDTDGTPVQCHRASVGLRDLGGFIMLDLTFSSTEAQPLKMVYAYLEKYGNDLDKLTESSAMIPEIAFFISSMSNEDYYILLTNPLFWSWNTSTRVGEYDSIRVLFEESNYGVIKEAE